MLLIFLTGLTFRKTPGLRGKGASMYLEGVRTNQVDATQILQHRRIHQTGNIRTPNEPIKFVIRPQNQGSRSAKHKRDDISEFRNILRCSYKEEESSELHFTSLLELGVSCEALRSISSGEEVRRREA